MPISDSRNTVEKRRDGVHGSSSLCVNLRSPRACEQLPHGVRNPSFSNRQLFHDGERAFSSLARRLRARLGHGRRSVPDV